MHESAFKTKSLARTPAELHLEGFWGALGRLWGGSWAPFGRFWVALGRFLRHFCVVVVAARLQGSIWEGSGRVLGGSWAALGHLLGAFGRSWAILGTFLRCCFRNMDFLTLFARFFGLWGRFWIDLGRLGEVLLLVLLLVLLRQSTPAVASLRAKLLSNGSSLRRLKLNKHKEPLLQVGSEWACAWILGPIYTCLGLFSLGPPRCLAKRLNFKIFAAAAAAGGLRPNSRKPNG